jgi:precorrin-6Y C5,15-methyltransferase (decarboxylating)
LAVAEPGGNTLYVVGAGSGTPGQLTPEAAGVIGGCRFIAGGERLLALAEGLAPGDARTHAVDADFDGLLQFISRGLDEGDVCVLASGDPGCFSILPLLNRNFADLIQVIPGISSVQMLAARLRSPWQDWRLVSLHGRAAAPLAAPRTRTVFFCDRDNPPQAVAARLMKVIPGGRGAVGARLGQEDEIFREGSLEELAAGDFPAYSLLLAAPGESGRRPVSPAAGQAIAAGAPGIPDDMWLRREGVPLSKSEVRAVLMSKARPAGRRVIWDVGAGTGSYGIECSLLEPRAQVIAIDKNPVACHLVADNAARFGTRVEVVCMEAPEGFETLAAPDLVIIGGNEGMLSPIFKSALRTLQPAGRIVVTALLEETKQTAHRLFAESGLEARAATRVTIARGSAHEWIEQNPVIIFTGDQQRER